MKMQIALRMFLAMILVATLPSLGLAQKNFDHARRLVSQTHSDLKAVRAERLDGKERERYDNALKHLSEFDQALSKSKYDKDKLDEAIEDLSNVVKNNVLSPDERDPLQ